MTLGLLVSSTWATSVSGSQPLVFVMTWGGSQDDTVSGIAADPSGYIYVAGTTSSFGSSYSKVAFLRFAPSGDLTLSETWGGNNTDIAHALAIDSHGYIYLAGETKSFSANVSAFILKYNSTGALIWQRSWEGYGHSQAFSIAADRQGGVYAAGSTFDSSRNDAFLLKFNSTTANLLWQRIYNQTLANHGRGVSVDNAGDVYVTGDSSTGIPEAHSAFLVKYDSSGNPIWAREWSVDYGAGLTFAYGVGVEVSASNNIYVVGRDALLLKFNSSGDPIWARTWGGDSGQGGADLAQDSFGDTYVIGTTSASRSGGSDAFLLKFDPAGKVLLQSTWGGIGYNDGVALTLDNNGYPLLVGNVREPPPYSFGNPTFKSSSPSFGSLSFVQQAVITSYPLQTPNGNVTTVSGSMTYAGGADVFLLKYNPLSGLATPPYLPLAILLLIAPMLRARSRAKSHSPQYSADWRISGNLSVSRLRQA